MKNYSIYVFTRDNCTPCTRMKEYVTSLPEKQRAELHLVPLLTSDGSRTALATECEIDLTPTMVVIHDDVYCELWEADEFCEPTAEVVESFVGANAVIAAIPSILEAYTYSCDE